MTEMWQRTYKKARWLFQSKHTVGIIIAFWTSGIGVALASYSNLIPKEAFYLAYGLFSAAFIWSLGAFLVWWANRNPRPQNRNARRSSRKKTRGTRFWIWQIGTSLAMTCFFLFC